MSNTPPFIRYGLYPLVWVLLIGFCAYAWRKPEQIVYVQIAQSIIFGVILLSCEWLFPCQRRWGLTRALLLKRDLVLIVTNGLISRLLTTAFAILAVYVASFSSGPMAGTPLWLQIIVGLLVYDFMQYALHWLMHQSRGPLTHFLWRSHATHHLPKQLYMFVHFVQHPVQEIAMKVIVMLVPVALLGYDHFAVFVFTSIITLHGFVSHLNVDIRLGWLNYVFVGPELHRYHHSSNLQEASNYSSTLIFPDLVFGTFLYRPGTPPDNMGLSEADGYPAQTDAVKALLLPFHTGPVQAIDERLLLK